MAAVHGARPVGRRLRLLALVVATTIPTSWAPADVAAGADEAWVETTLAGLDLRGRAAQLVMVRAFGQHRHPDDAERQALLAAVRDDGVGGVVAFDADLDSLPRVLRALQAVADLPLLVASDLERSAAFRVRRNTTPLPYAMAIGATGSEAMAYDAGAITAREARALGVHWIFAPVADVNVAADNPVIGLRAFGEDPHDVGRLVAAFVRGARSIRGPPVLTTAKHFPGHGDTAVDSHEALPIILADRERLETVELVPFRSAIEARVDTIMLGHLAVPALDPSGTPASLSRPIVDGMLRGAMGFDGLIVTDALEMKGVRADWPGDAVVRAVGAGVDVVLLPQDHRVAIDALVRAVGDGVLPAQRIDDAARRVLLAKARVGLARDRGPAIEALDRDIARPEDVRRGQAMAEAAVTLVRNRGAVVPLRAELPLRLLHIVLTPYPTFRGIGMRDALEDRGIDVDHRAFARDVTPSSIHEMVRAAGNASHVLVSLAFSTQAGDLSAAQRQLLDALVGSPTPVVAVALDSPYLLDALPDVDAFLCTFSGVDLSQHAVVAALLGEVPITGTLPVSLPGGPKRGHGLSLPRRSMDLPRRAPASVGLAADAFDGVDRMLDEAVADGAFPGGVLAVGYRDALVHLRPFGRQTYADDAPAVEADTLYDLASLTKVIVTTTMAMMLVDDEALHLDARLTAFLPRFTGERKERVTLRHLLTHSAGVDWWAPLYETLEGPAAYREHVQAMPLVAEPGTVTRYSDLGVLLLGEALVRAAGTSLDDFAHRRIFEPLGMVDTGFNPATALRTRIAPTEIDTTWRHRLVHGEVHDENAFALGGVAPHAGLFGTAPDLARFAQMLLNGGVFDHRRLITRATVEEFTRKAGVVEGSDRALGWDTKSATGSSAGSRFSATSFGHTGFTGTSIWLDPERRLFVILLTNRVHPTRENRTIRAVRPAVADAVVAAIEGTP